MKPVQIFYKEAVQIFYMEPVQIFYIEPVQNITLQNLMRIHRSVLPDDSTKQRNNNINN